MNTMTPILSEIVAEGKTIETTKVTTRRFTMTTDDFEKLVTKLLNLGEGDSVTFRWNIGQWPDLGVTIVSKTEDV